MEINNIAVIGGFQFPYGMASTQRILIISDVLIKNGYKVSVFCTEANEKTHSNNIYSKGEFKGIKFYYLPGTTRRPKSFLKRNALKIISIMRLISRLRTDQISEAYLWGTMMELSFWGLLQRIILKLSNIKIIAELNERPWSLSTRKNIFTTIISPLIFIDKVIAISDYLEKWSIKENIRIKKNIQIYKIPMLVEPSEFENRANGINMELFYSASDAYFNSMIFILNSMKFVWRCYPSIKLTLSGFETNSETSDNIKQFSKDRNYDLRNIEFVGYLPRIEYIRKLSHSYALLLPLNCDLISLARFPNKLGEYLLSGRPTICSYVGEVKKYLSKQDSYLVEKYDEEAFGAKIVESLSNPILAQQIGNSGRLLAMKMFSPRNWDPMISRAFRE